MRKPRSTEEQTITILKEAEATGQTGKVGRRHGISREALSRWRRNFGGLQIPEAKRLRALEEENRRPKRVVADQALNLQVLKNLLRKEW